MKTIKPVTPDFIKSIRERTLLDEIRYYGFYIWWNYLDMLPRRIYWFFQRGYRGYSDCDTWDFDRYLATVISQGLKHIKKYHHSLEPTKKELDIMIKGFEANLKMQDSNFNPRGFETLSLQLKFRKGMELFTKYFNYLWD